MQTVMHIMLHLTHINYILQNNAPTNTTLPGFIRKMAVFNIWEHGPHFHMFMWNKTLVCTWKLGFSNVFSKLMNAYAGIKVELWLLSKNRHAHSSNFPSYLIFLVISILTAVWKGEITSTAADTALAECLFLVCLFLAELIVFFLLM